MKTQPEFKIIADHLRSSCFLIADGVMPSNEGRGYVLRRIMRRAMRQIHKLGAKEATMHKLVDALIKEMGVAYPELVRARATIIESLKNEEEKFRETLEKGLRILEEEISKTNYSPLEGESNHKVVRWGVKNADVAGNFDPSPNRQQADSPLSPENDRLGHFLSGSSPQGEGDCYLFPGAIAFKLYDTYGFPLDLTQDILKEKNIELDVEGFNHEMEIQRKRAKENWVGSGETVEEKIFFDLKEKHGETKFLGYETLSAKAKVLAIIEGGIILDQTPFYATSGGQKGDDGKIGDVEIFETKKFAGGLFVHFFSSQRCELKINDKVEAIVNPKTRQMRAANHSSTHLLHKALKEVLGNSISQKGSNVDAEYFTFDFNFNRAVTDSELGEIENLVNFAIRQNSPVKTNLMSLEKARETGAEALFGEKYDAEVRVVKMGSSVELCGGTHAKHTGEIGIFKIISEKGIAAGIRRIEARTGISAINYLRDQEKKSAIEINDLQQELKRREKEIARLSKQLLLGNLGNFSAEKFGSINLLHHIFENIEAKEIREIASEIRARKEFSTAHIFAFFGCKEGKVSVCIALSSDLLEKFDANKLIVPVIEAIGGKGGGGKKDLAMGGGSNKSAIPQAIELLKKNLNNH